MTAASLPGGGQSENKNPAHAVCCGVLNLLLQVDSDPVALPWQRPIASPPKMGSPYNKRWLKTESATSRTQQGRFLILQSHQRGE
jgi:hypothetical protein